jgi:hypothetical protein
MKLVYKLDYVMKKGQTNQADCSGLTIGDDFNAVVTENTHARVGRAKIYADCGDHGECLCLLWMGCGSEERDVQSNACL